MVAHGADSHGVRSMFIISRRKENLMSNRRKYCFLVMTCTTLLAACATAAPPPSTRTLEAAAVPTIPPSETPIDLFKRPLITDLYTADPSAHVFDGKIYIYPSHDLDHDTPDNGNGDG